MGLAQRLMTSVGHYIPKQTRDTMKLQGFGMAKVPMILYCRPKVRRLDDQACHVEIPLNWRTRNHYKSLYFGAFAVGADCASGFLAMQMVWNSGKNVQLLFKDFKAEFHKRATGNVLFECSEGRQISEMVHHAAESPERVNHVVEVVAKVPSQSPDPVAHFWLTLSLKQYSKKT